MRLRLHMLQMIGHGRGGLYRPFLLAILVWANRRNKPLNGLPGGPIPSSGSSVAGTFRTSIDESLLMRSLLPILFVLAFSSCKKEEFSPDRTKEFSIHSTTNGATYVIQVGLPENYSPETRNYGAIYVLDGAEIFDHVAQSCNTISGDNGASNILVVGIGYGNDRAFDYTPSATGDGGGGAENFLLFIKNELIPRIESEFGADTARTSRSILGHSFGGLCAAYAFTNHNEMFENYIMLSPSLWYDDGIVLRSELEHRDANKLQHQLVFLGLGELENSGNMLAPFQAFHDRLRDNYPSMALKRHIVPGLGHRGSEKPNIIEGLNFYFANKR